MKKKILCGLFAIVMVASAVLLAACGGTDGLQGQIDELTRQNEQLSEENEQLLQEMQQLQSDLAEMQEEFAKLIKENDLTQEELLDVEYKFKKLIGTGWPGENVAYASDRLYVRVGQEYLDETFTAEDFLPVEAAEVALTYRGDAFAEYLLTLRMPGVKELIYAMMKLYTFDFVEELQLYERASEWQLAADRGGYFIGVRNILLDGPLTAEDLAPVSVTEVIPVEGVRAFTDYRDPTSGDVLFTTVGFYVITVDGPREGVLETLSSMEIVDYAWENTYDYETRQYPMEEKEVLEKVPDSWLGFFGSYALNIDQAYAARIFTVDDFAGFAAEESVTWSNYSAFKNSEAYDSPVYSIGVLDREAPHSVIERYGKLISRLDYVQTCYPNYAMTDFPGYPSEGE